MTMEIRQASPAAIEMPITMLGGGHPAVQLPGGLEVAPVSFAGGTVLEKVVGLAKGWHEALESADAGIRACQMA
ncbi:MAG: hypothetical protein ACAI44_24290 [Candidatus Sericytochromatia bacterium]